VSTTKNTTTKTIELGSVDINGIKVCVVLDQKLEQTISINYNGTIDQDDILEVIIQAPDFKKLLDKAQCAIHNAKTRLADVPEGK